MQDLILFFISFDKLTTYSEQKNSFQQRFRNSHFVYHFAPAVNGKPVSFGNNCIFFGRIFFEGIGIDVDGQNC
jgi:hypothetical protein